MLFPYYFSRVEACPPVFRVYCEADPMERRTLLRAPNETDQQFCARTQRKAYHLWLASGCKPTRIECVYEVPSPSQDPFFYDDERWMDITTLRSVLDRKDEPAEVRIACAKALNRIHRLVDSEVW